MSSQSHDASEVRLYIQMTHPLHQHGLIPIASGLLDLPPLALVLVHHHSVDGVGVCVPVTEISRGIPLQRLNNLAQTPHFVSKSKRGKLLHRVSNV